MAGSFAAMGFSRRKIPRSTAARWQPRQLWTWIMQLQLTLVHAIVSSFCRSHLC